MSDIKNITHSIPILRHTVSFLAGIIISDILPIGNKYLIFIALASLLFALILKDSKRILLQKIYSFVIGFLIICLGALYTNTYRSSQFRYDIPTQGYYAGKVNDMSPASKNREKLVVQLKSVSNDTSKILVNEKIVLFVPDSISETDITPGDFIGFKARLYPIEHSNNPGDFNYKKYMNRRAIRYQSYIYKLPYHSNHHQTSLKTLAVNTRSNLLDSYRKAGINNQEFAVLSALTLGEKNYIDKELKQQFSNSGAMHVLAVSGLHVGILFFVFSFILKPLNYSSKTKVIKVFLLIILLWSYALITGMSPSVMRAATMFSFLVIGQNLNRNTNIYNTLALSAMLLMIIKPDIIYEVGFQLSYVAVTSIVFFQPKIARLGSFKNRIAKSSWELFAVSVSAQLGTLPFSLYYFHQFPVYFWISNFVVIPAATILLYGSILFFIMLPFPAINGIVGSFLSGTVKLMNILIARIDNLPVAVISDLWVDQATVVTCYTIIFTIGLILVSRKYKYILILFSFLLILLIKDTFNSYQTQNQSYLVFYNHYNDNILSIINGRKHYYYCQSDSLSTYSERLLNNSTGYFHTTKPVLLPRDTLLNNNLYRRNNQIFFKKIQIQINKNGFESENINDSHAHLTWGLSDIEINVNKKQNIALRAFKNGKLNYFRPIIENNDSLIKTNQYAVIVETW
ncbi:MAG: ComEC/Rec2 family competence protein [Prolixibacteraceae bacterium]|jgi:competence protein ComEC|nr:ComEC/Rec2 family competence protein [Prolixibacteraceae bacterium]